MPPPPDPRALGVTVAQPLMRIGDVDANIDAMAPMVAAAAEGGAHLVVFSECGITGYDKRGIAVEAAIALDDPRLEQVSALARAHRIAIVAGLYERAGDGIYNTALFVHPDGTRDAYRKHHIVGYEQAETPVRAAERRAQTFALGGLRLGIQICSDGGAPGYIDELAEAGCDALVAITAGVGEAEAAFDASELGDPETRKRYLAKQESVCFVRNGIDAAIQRDMGLVCCNQAGWDPEKGYFQPGHSAVVDHTGEMTALIPGQFAPQFLRPRHATGFLTPRAVRPEPLAAAPAAATRDA